MDRDTHPTQNRLYHELLQRATPTQKTAMIRSLWRGVRRVCEAGIRFRHPEAGDEEVRVRMCVRLYGREVAGRVCKTNPDDAV